MPVTDPAASYAAYPVKDDVEALVSGAGITIPATFNVEYQLYGAIEELEQTTGYRPFLAGASDTYRFDPPGPNDRGMRRGGSRLLLLDQAFVTVTEVRTGVTPDDAGTVLVENEDYYLRPENYDKHLEPITQILFASIQYGLPRSIKVTGTPGYAEEIRADVWNAVRDLAAGRVAHALRQGIAAGQPIDWTSGDVSERRSIELLQKLGDAWYSGARRVIARYRFIH